MGIVWENTTPSPELPRDFRAGIGPLQLGVVLVFLFFKPHVFIFSAVDWFQPHIIAFDLLKDGFTRVRSARKTCPPAEVELGKSCRKYCSLESSFQRLMRKNGIFANSQANKIISNVLIG